MKQKCLLYALTSTLLICSTPWVYATEQRSAEQTETTQQITSEDQKVIALMDLLQKMELLTDLDMMAAGEVKK